VFPHQNDVLISELLDDHWGALKVEGEIVELYRQVEGLSI